MQLFKIPLVLNPIYGIYMAVPPELTIQPPASARIKTVLKQSISVSHIFISKTMIAQVWDFNILKKDFITNVLIFTCDLVQVILWWQLFLIPQNCAEG